MKKPTSKSSNPRRSAGKSDPNRYPKNWDRKRVEDVIAHYEWQTDDQVIAEDDAAYTAAGFTIMPVPKRLVPAMEQLPSNRGVLTPDPARPRFKGSEVRR